MFEDSRIEEPRNVLGDWIVRGGIALVFIAFGSEKFDSQPGSHWVTLFREIGAGDWFRYFAGIVEILGGLLVLIPRTAIFGLALLGCTMGSAVLIMTFRLSRPGDSIFSGIFFLTLSALCWQRWLNRS